MDEGGLAPPPYPCGAGACEDARNFSKVIVEIARSLNEITEIVSPHLQHFIKSHLI